MESTGYSTKSEMVYQHVREDIIKGVFVPGDRLVISAIAKQYGISEIPVREAFQILVQEGFLNSRPNSGFTVSQISKKEVENIFQVRVALEALATQATVKLITEEGIQRLEALLDKSEQYISVQDYSAYWHCNREWHSALYSYCQNDMLIRMLGELFEYSRRYPAYYTKPEELMHSVRSHRAIVDALRRRDAEMADALIRSHTIETGYHYINRLEEVLGDKLEE